MTAAPVNLIVRGGTVATDRWSGPADVFVRGERIVAVTEPGTTPPGSAGATEVDAAGKLVLPGGVDPHCHVGFTSGDFTSLDDHAQATTAALFGGTTTIVDFAIPRPGQAPADVAYAQRAKAAGGLCDSALHACVVDWDASTPGQLDSLMADGIVTVKMFTTYRGENMADDGTILATMSHLRDRGGMAYVHCEANHLVEDSQRDSAAAGRISARHHHRTRTELAESASVASVLAIAESLGAPVYFVHQSTAHAADLVIDARRRGIRAFGEAVTHHLVLDDSAYGGDHPELFVCCPPLRSPATVEALRARLIGGGVSTIGSDHCCYDTGQKASARSDVRRMPNGLPGVETRAPVVFSEFVAPGVMPVERFVELTATNPARLNGLYPRKGTIQPGADADIAIWDPMLERHMRVDDLHMATDYTPYEGRRVTGWPVTVLSRGRVLIEDGVLRDTEPHGRHVPGVAFAQIH